MKEEIINVDERSNLLVAESTTNYGLIKPGQDDFYNVDEFNQNMDTIDKQLKVNENQIKNLESPYVIPEGTDILVQDRVKGKMYFKVTSRQSSGETIESVRVSPNMGIKVQE
ncbi:hypothetical protein [Zhenhengia yiwuensis]|uniref:hypothetical protein n=1 Tax=Zhenhengia yiwuensis TaxID=2763666 RepID=UPI002A74AF4B|nr:hypothetical protein [Zhenhengia yiwuensis]MDY3366513.1 hypothetical protein [Zhenhengia yiwuensis]